MKKRTIAVLVALLTFAVGVAIARFTLPRFRTPVPPPPPAKHEIQLSNYRISGPYQHENLTIFLVHGPDQAFSGPYTPLQQAMERKLVAVYETREVNELAIENRSASEEVFVQAGDIVKGGQQDRTLAVDLIVPTNSGRISIDAFCVESGRWTQRGIESPNEFTTSRNMIATKELKLATKAEASQAKVWREVETAKAELSQSVNADVADVASRSSMQLALENDKVRESSAKYVDELTSLVDEHSDAIGFVFAINNKLNSADVYPSHAMFKQFWPRLLKAAAVEAVTESSPVAAQATNEALSINAVGDFIVAAEKGSESLNEVTKRTHMVKRESERGIFFETRDMAYGGAWIHRNYLTQ
jgi:ARG/rhodanese/phosphatase superfamily protein